jgi:V/A-type H+-transporting ATPase subunit I
MALDSVVKIQVVCHTARRDEVLAVIESSGRVHLQDLSETDFEEEMLFTAPVEVDTEDLADRLSELDRVIGFLGGFAMSKKSLREKLTSVPPEYSEKELKEMLEDSELAGKARESWRVAMDLAKIEGNEKEHITEIEFLETWMDLPCDLLDLRKKGVFRLAAGTAERESIRKVHALSDDNPLLSMKVLRSTPSVEQLLAIYHSSIEGEILQKLSECGFTIQDFGARKGLVRELRDRSIKELEDLRLEEEELEGKAGQLAKYIPEFSTLRDAVGLFLTRMRATENGRAGNSVVQFRAWVRENDLDALERELELHGEVMVQVIDPDDGETAPSPITANKLTDPYVMLTDMFGQPTRQDPDPTPLMAPFYALFFGICIGDAGYGIALALGSALGWFLSSRRGGNPRLFKLLFQGGLASILIGIFLGGWFGISFDNLPAILKAPAELLNSLVPGYARGQTGQETFGISQQFLYVTLALGLLQLSWGIVVNLTKRLRAGEGLSAIFDQAGWLLATAGLFPWLFNHYLLDGALYDINGPADRIFLFMLLFGTILIFVMGGKKGKGFGKIGLGAYAAYGIVNLLGDVLSYSRLFALALSSAIIALVINQIAGMLIHDLGIPVVGVVLAILVLAGGHLFNLFMAALSGFIHTARLQFVEFFSKFYDGTGIPFVPLKYNPEYVQIKKSSNQTLSGGN